MKVMQDLTITDPEEIFSRLLLKSGGVSLNWSKSNSDYQKQIKQYCFDYIGSEFPVAKLWLIKDNDIYRVTNIVPQEKYSLEVEEYNALLKSFASEVLSSNNLHFQIEPEVPLVGVDYYMGTKAMRALSLFSSTANRATGTGHPLDQEKWFQFVAIGVRDNKLAPVDVIREYLLQDGWSEEKTDRLCFEYEYCIDVMRFCFKNSI